MPRATETLGEVFLKNFVRHLLINSYVPGEEISQNVLEKNEPMQESQFQIQNVQQSPPPQIITQQKKPIQNIPRKNIVPQKQFQMQKREPMQIVGQTKQNEKPVPPALLEYKPSLPSQGQIQNPVNLGRITSLLLDPSVISVECPGPSRNVLVNRAGSIQTTSIVLPKEEIDKILNEVSEKTRIPVTQGVFKTAFQDLVMTAVVSEFVGTRFIIQKINPFQESY